MNTKFRLARFGAILLSSFFAAAVWAADGPIAVWEFSESANRGLNQTTSSVGGVAFDGGATGIRTDGNGALEVRRPLGTAMVRNAAIGPIDSGRVWLAIDFAGWNITGAPTEELRFGFAGAEGLEEPVAVLEWKRLTDSKIWIHGTAQGDGATDAAVDELLPARHLKTIRYVLECDLDRYTYEIIKQVEGGPWTTVGRGAVAQGSVIQYLGVSFASHFSDTADEGLKIDRLAVTREDPVDRANWTPLAEHPFVTAWSWAVGDARTGEVIAGHNVDVPRKSASVTKAMTTYLACELAKEDPSILDEMVHFSELALTARGSTANIEAGESLPLRDALYAFMLPSGNAVGNAIAEHFRDRLPRPDGAAPDEKLDPRANFIGEMNRVAARLGMTQTIYRSAFGDGGNSTDDRTTTARDLIRLAHAAMQNDLFREVVGTKEYSAKVTRPDGSTRIASWTNTNQFLGEEGYNGIKTGTTNTARACLLTSATLNERPLYAIVLGSSHSSRRYVDSRNLLEWVAARDPGAHARITSDRSRLGGNE